MRRQLPPHYELETRPGLNDIALPSALDAESVNRWAFGSIAKHLRHIAEKGEPDALQTSFDSFLERFDADFMADVEKILLWFSGKDILAGMADWLSNQRIAENPGKFRALLRDWIRENPEKTLELLPEWMGLVEAVRT